MQDIALSLFLIGTLLLGISNIIMLPNSILHGSRLQRGVLIVFIALALVVCYYLSRAGFIADEQHIGGNQVAPLYGTEWYYLFGVGLLAFFYQYYLLRIHKPRIQQL